MEIHDDPFWRPAEMVANRRETDRAEIMRRLDEAYAKIEAEQRLRRQIEEETAWAEYEARKGT